MKLITPSALVERLKINASLARAAIKVMAEEGKIVAVVSHHSQMIYTRVVVE
jgi:small subunit ribosomal protein S25e